MMRFQPLFCNLFAAVLCVSVARAGEDDAKSSDLERLQGSWLVILHERNGELTDKGMTHITIRGKSVETIMDGKSVESGQLTLNPNASPKQYDFTITGDSDLVGRTFQGIYRIQGDTYQTCVNIERDGKRPSSFCTAADSGTQMIVWRRVGTIPNKTP